MRAKDHADVWQRVSNMMANAVDDELSSSKRASYHAMALAAFAQAISVSYEIAAKEQEEQDG